MTTDLPYADADLRHEAARQLATLTEDPDFMGIGERMEAADIASTVPPEGGEGRQWDDLAPHEFTTAQHAIDDLLTNAADTSEWAINLGADGLEPSPDQVTVNGDNRPIARIHFAFGPGMPADARADFITGIGEAIADLL